MTILEATMKILDDMATCHPGFLQPRFNAL
jgi:hypothetical protein